MENRKLEMEEKQQEFQEEMAKNTVKFSKMLKNVGPVDTEMERNRAEAKIIEGWEQLVKNTASKVVGSRVQWSSKMVG